MNHDEILTWLQVEEDDDLDQLWAAADETRRVNVGDEVHLRGLIEVSNFCQRSCTYCGIAACAPKVERYRMSQEDILDFCVNPAYQDRAWPQDYWPATPAPPDARTWAASVAAVKADRKALLDLLRDPHLDLYATIPHGSGQTYLREFLLVADHNAFHLGQMLVVRRLLGAWG